MTWEQVYDPFNNQALSTIVASLPVLTLFFVLIALKKRVWVSALSGLLMAVLVALVVLKNACGAGDNGGFARLCLRLVAYCVDHRRFDFSL